MKPNKIKTPFKYDGDDTILMIAYQGFVWFETDFETITEFKAEWIIWAAKQLEQSAHPLADRT